MIEILTIKDCPYCDVQKDIMQKDFFGDEYRLIKADSDEFSGHECRGLAVDDGFPCVVIRDELGNVRFATNGVVDGDKLRETERAIKFASLQG
jgi:hypothetical protein